ncbi:hypothetical protein AC578_10771 [Pseudocercospora eumusae]|uniref:GH18 domain-containing protein n=1 Tax=Pseudocercospora eumusae TaxID=321146 RepID=A0A139GZW7_9PEZI|nr:hypothetical protein AC578_10771 [Pseudocercospora eumusae]
MFGLLMAWLGLLAFASALPAELSFIEKRDAYSTPRNVVYVQTFKTTSGGQLSLLPLVQQNTQVTHIYLAAVHINSNPGDITLNDNNPNDTIWDTVWSEAAQLQQAGVKVMMMMGGAAPGSYPRLCSGEDGAVINEDYYIPLRDTLKYHNVDGLDLDIEEQVAYTCPLALLQRLNSDFGSNFILTMAPVASELQPSGYGLGGFSYKTLDSQATSSSKPNGKLVNWFNAQFYNGWGDASNPTGYNAIINNGYTPSRVVLGLLDNPNDGGSGWYGLDIYKTNIATLKANYPDFGCVTGWEYWDAGERDGLDEPWKWVQSIGAAVFTSEKGEVNKTANVTNAVSPWPVLTQEIVNLGAPWLAAIRALNITDGNLTKALQILGLPPIHLGDIVEV